MGAPTFVPLPHQRIPYRDLSAELLCRVALIRFLVETFCILLYIQHNLSYAVKSSQFKKFLNQFIEHLHKVRRDPGCQIKPIWTEKLHP